MSVNEKKGITNSLIVNSVSAAIVCDPQKTKNSLILIAYSKGNTLADIRFTALRLPKRLCTRADFLAAIATAENVQNVTYVDYDGTNKDIYICRPKDGEVTDFVERDDARNKFSDGFAEMEASTLKFSCDPISLRPEKSSEISVSYAPNGAKYPQNSLQYAIVNCYNACLLGRLFSEEEFHLETGENQRVKFEVRSVAAKYVDLSTLYIRPEIYEGDQFVSSYLTETINVINGETMQTKTYRLIYRASFHGYYITRAN